MSSLNALLNDVNFVGLHGNVQLVKNNCKYNHLLLADPTCMSSWNSHVLNSQVFEYVSQSNIFKNEPEM